MRTLDGLRRGGRSVVWFVRGLIGEDAYEKYSAHVAACQAAGGHEQPMTEREFWRDLTDRQERNPQGRCC